MTTTKKRQVRIECSEEGCTTRARHWIERGGKRRWYCSWHLRAFEQGRAIAGSEKSAKPRKKVTVAEVLDGLTRPKRRDDTQHGLVTILVGTAGIGGQSFKAWLQPVRDGKPIDRQHGSDQSLDGKFNVYATPGEALAAFGRRIDAQLAQQAWWELGDSTDEKTITLQDLLQRSYGDDR